jgi:hypothetical protein
LKSRLSINRQWSATTRVVAKISVVMVVIFVNLPFVFAQVTPDTSAPVLKRITLLPDNVYLDSINDSGLEVSLTLVFDDQNAVSTSDFYLQSAATGEQVQFLQVGSWETLGTQRTGVFSANLTSVSSAGVWHLNSLIASDSVNNASTQYDTLEKLLLARLSPFISVASSSTNLIFDSLIEANPTFSQTAASQTSYLDITLQDTVEYDVWFVPYATTSFTNIAFSGGISIAQACSITANFAKCTVTSSNNNSAILAQVDTLANNLNTFGYSVFVQPNALGTEAQWRTNYIEFPPLDFDNDGIPNEQDLDDDNDSVVDTLDLFPLDASETADFDGDGVGNNADLDDDNDDVPDELDAFPFDPSENNDNDFDGQGDVADNDDDNDLVIDTLDAFPFDPSESLDTDGDGIGNNADIDDDNDGGTDDNDAFPLDPTETIDSDGDGIGNNADTDDDNDGVLDVDDAFIRDPTESIDTDEDGIGNNADDDDDNDGILDVDDLFPLDAGDFRDNDLDGIGDNADDDDDNDGIPDIDDAFPFNSSESRDNDGDGIGNNADPDDDNDGLDDFQDEFPFDASEVADFDGDRIGNNADTDDDNDGVLDIVDAFPFAVTEWLDTDNDGIGNNADLDNDNDGVDDQFDAFDNDPLETIDTDADGIGNNNDSDDDNDAVPDIQDAFPLDATESLDTDSDGIGNNEDSDDDGDRVPDISDLFPLDPRESLDNDLDGVGNNTDTDDDNDGVLDIDDIFPFDASETLDNDADGVGNNADTDDDNDGFDDIDDLFPFDQTEWADNDLDGQGDNRDTDDDNDGVLDNEDAFDFDATETIDTDVDGIGNNADTDDDNDGVLDEVDAFPLAVAESLDSDGDGIGNNADTDDDNDGIVDIDDSQPLNPTIGDEQAPTIDNISDLMIEATGMLTPVELIEPRVRDNNLNPASLSNDYQDALPLGEHIVTWTAVDFAGNISTLEQIITVLDTTAPEFGSVAFIDIVSRGIFTDVSQDIIDIASDLVDGVINPTVLSQNKLKAGRQSVILQAQDGSGNTSTKEYFVNILPAFTAKSTGLTAPGNTLSIILVLSGKAPAYPVSVEYTIAGPVTSETSGVFEIAQGQQGELNISVAPTARLGEQIRLNFANPQNAVVGRLSQIVIDVSNANRAPVTDIKLMQNNNVVSVAYQDQGNVTLVANINDLNLDDDHQVIWQITPARNVNQAIAIIDSDSDSDIATFVFEPALLAVGQYIAKAEIAERNTAQLYTSEVEFAFTIGTAMPILSALIDSDFDGLPDQLEGLTDSDLDGVADYLDNDSNTSSLPTGASQQPLTTLAGYRLTLGDIVKYSGVESAANATVSAFDIQNYGLSIQYPNVQVDDPHFDAIQEITNFNIENLYEIGESVPVVIPLNSGTVIPADAVYRKFNSRDGWFTFVENAHNAILTAPFDNDGNCPQSDSGLYINGLSAGDTCITLIIQDGGPNDGDLKANGIIKDPGVLSARLPNRSPLINVAQQITVFEGENVRVDASLTTDAEGDNLIFTWTQVGGLRIELGENISPLLSFDTPEVSRNESLLFRLDVYDGRDTSSVPVRVNIQNRNTPPTVVLEAHNNAVDEMQQIVLNANVNDDDGDLLTYEWRQLSGPAVLLSGQNTQSVVVTMPQVDANQAVSIAIFVSDSEKQVSAVTTINIVNTPITASLSAEANSGGGAMSLYILLMGFLIALTRKRPAT